MALRGFDILCLRFTHLSHISIYKLLLVCTVKYLQARVVEKKMSLALHRIHYDFLLNGNTRFYTVISVSSASELSSSQVATPARAQHVLFLVRK